MSQQSDDTADWHKRIEEHFRVRGFQDILVTGSGGRWADVYACNRETKNFAIIEGKSEKNCASGEASECPYPERDYYVCDLRRREMWNIVERVLPPILRPKRVVVHALAVTIWHQLYCYYWDILGGQCPSKKLSERRWACPWPPTFESTEPYLVVPLQHLDPLDWVTHEFQSQTWLPQVKPVVPDDQRGIAVARIYYPTHRPCDLSKSR